MSPTALQEFPTAIPIPVQWGEQDAIGHVNNVVPLRWIESSRIRYLEEKVDPILEAHGLGLILAANHIHYRLQLNYPDTIWAATKAIRIGGKSFTFAAAIYSENQQAIAVDGEAVMVCFNYRENRSQEIPADVRAAIEAIEGHSL